MKRQAKQQGSILIEAMIALIVLAVGIAAIAKLQGEFTRGGGDAQARNVALQLAQQKMDDLKTYNQIPTLGQNWSNSTAYPTTRPYGLIQDNQGGGTLGWANGRNTIIGNTAYSVSWRVSNFTWPSSNFYSIGTETNSFAQTDYKKVVMTVTWHNYPSMDVQQVDLVGNIAKLSDFGSKTLSSTQATGGGPAVHYNPGSAPDVIAIDSGGESIETTLPEPAIKTLSGVPYYYSQFETVTYAGGIALREEEFLNINCDCKYDSVNYIGTAYPIGRIIWHPNPEGSEQDQADLATYVNSYFHPPESQHQFISQKNSGRADFVGNQIRKVKGIPDQDQAGKQHPFCNICCRDHHDGNDEFLATRNDPASSGLSDDQVTGAYACKPDENFADAGDEEGDRSHCADPWRDENNYHSSTGDHKHYTAARAEVVPGGSGTYKESCRLKRVNGNFFVFQDWHLHGSTYVAAARQAFTPGAVNNVLTAYRAYIGNYITQVTANGNNQPVTTIINPATHYRWPQDTGVSPPVTTHFIARGIYMDYLDSFTLGKLNDARVNHPTTFIENVAFNEINVTRLTDWQPQCINGDPPGKGDIATIQHLASAFVADNNGDGNPDAGSCVTNYGIISAGDADHINRGQVFYTTTSSLAVASSMLLSNTGIVGTNLPLLERLPATVYPTTNDRSYDTTPVIYTYNISGGGSTTTTSSTTTTTGTATTTTTTTTVSTNTITVSGAIIHRESPASVAVTSVTLNGSLCSVTANNSYTCTATYTGSSFTGSLVLSIPSTGSSQGNICSTTPSPYTFTSSSSSVTHNFQVYKTNPEAALCT